MKSTTRTDLLALVLSLLTVLAAYFFVAEETFEQIPHIEDEMAFVWQGRVFTHGEITVASPPHPKNIFIPFVIDYNGQRFGKYPPGWPMMLSFGIRLGMRTWVNPLLAGVSVWLTYRLAQKIFSGQVALLSALLTAASPFFLINAGSLLSHTWSLFLALSFVVSWIDTFDIRNTAEPVPKWMTTTVAGLTLGLLAITRPLTALGVATPFFLHGLVLLVRGSRAVRKHVLTIGAMTAIVASFLYVWQYAVTGNPLLNPYTLYWPYDKVGFGQGFGRQEGGHSLYWSWRNLMISLRAVEKDGFGWGKLTWVFLPFGVWAARRKLAGWLAVGIPLGLVGFYALYWVTSTITGPRYYYEGISTLSILNAGGIAWLAGKWQKPGRTRFILTSFLVFFLFCYNLFSYLPVRLASFHNLYGIQRADLEPFLTPEAERLTPAIVFVHVQDTWTDYGGLLDLQDPRLTTPFIFAMSRSITEDATLAKAYPKRQILHYYPDEPNIFYLTPR